MSDAMNRPWVYCPECGLYQKDADAKIVELEEKYTSLLQRQNDAEWQARGCAERLGWDGHGCAVGWLGNKIEEQAQEIERLKANVANWERKEIGRAIDCHGQEQRAKRAEAEVERLKLLYGDPDYTGFSPSEELLKVKLGIAERERDEALELCQREVANANKTTTAALLMGAQTNEALKEARKALVWIVDHWPGPIVGGKICALLGRARWPDEHMAAVRAARGGAEDE